MKGSSSKSYRERKLPVVPVQSSDIVIPSVKSWSGLYATDSNSLDDPSLNSFVVRNTTLHPFIESISFMIFVAFGFASPFCENSRR